MKKRIIYAVMNGLLGGDSPPNLVNKSNIA